MKRRQFVGAASAALAATLWPSFVRDAFGDDPACTGSPLERVARVAASLRRAREGARPLLVFVIPADDGAKYTRGEAFGELINHGDDAALAPLARAEVLCATMDDLRRLVPTAGAGDPLMVLVNPERVPATARQLDAELPATENRYDEGYWKDRERKDDALSDRRIALLTGLVQGALGPAGPHAAVLAAEVRKQLKDRPPLGAKWAKGAGCGLQVEGEPPMAIGCGMGHVPRKAQRFLYFFTDRRF
jgi:hypothetical protein